MKKLLPIVSICILCASVYSCGRRPLRPDQMERNRLFAEILYRQDHRSLGNDDFFPKHLADASQPQVQEWCALALGRIGNPKALPWLCSALHSPYAAVRAASAFAIGETEDIDLIRNEGRAADSQASGELRSLLHDTALSVIMRAAEALGKIGQKSDAIEIALGLETLALNGSPLQRAYLNLAITALMRLNNPATYPTLERLAGLPDPEIQWRVANAIYRTRAKDSRPVLERLLQNSNPDVQAHAARALGICEDPGLATLLEPWLYPQYGEHTTPLSVRVSALQALVLLKKPRSATAIQQAVLAAPIGESNYDQIDQLNFVVQALAALGNLGNEEHAATVQRFVLGPGPVATSAVVALAKLRRVDPDAFFREVAGRRFDTAAGMRAWATALGELGGERARGELKSMLARAVENPASAALSAAIPAILGALAKAQEPDVQEILSAYLSGVDGVIVRAALEGYRPAPGSPAPWNPILKAATGYAAKSDFETRIAILNRLEPWIAVAEVQSYLRLALEDPERNARIAAMRLLKQAGVQGLPDDPGPSHSSASQLACSLLAAARQDRTTAILETARGTIEIELFRQDAPFTVSNFITLARSGSFDGHTWRGFFDGHTFMRVVPYFVIQGGDPRDDQEGGPGYSIRCEINMRPFERGSVGMALSGKDTGGSQFFITLSPQPHLDGSYTCFGRVISGMPIAEHMIAGDRILRVRIKEDVTLLDYRNY
jgi:cyclophilin family peptidyl-prolyl cis-trans isomerase/HEAT repeat protein